MEKNYLSGKFCEERNRESQERDKKGRKGKKEKNKVCVREKDGE